MNVTAVDGDMPKTPDGFGDVQYSLSGENSALFSIDSMTGEIRVSAVVYCLL